jgi:exodeoxyribonuclease VII large subunit
MENQNLKLSVSEFIAITNQTLEYAYPSVDIEGEVSSFKVNQGKFVFFDIKDAESSIGCFMMIFALRIPVEDGMKVVIRAIPKLTKWGKFSLTVQSIRPSGDGSLKKSFELLKSKLDQEGLFNSERKRSLPSIPSRIAIISSTGAAGYADFCKIINDRWGGLMIQTAHVQVQGEVAPDQMIRALKYFNEQEILPDVIVIVRGGGSADDLSCFNDELLVRAVAASRTPVLTGIGHETDESLVDLAADLAAATPSNAAQLLVPDKEDIRRYVRGSLRNILSTTDRAITTTKRESKLMLNKAFVVIENAHIFYTRELASHKALMQAYDPKRALARGYSIVRGDVKIGTIINIETKQEIITAEVQHVKQK